MKPDTIHIPGQAIRDYNWGVLTQTIEKSVKGVPSSWFENNRLVLSWEQNPPEVNNEEFDEVSKILLRFHNDYRSTLALPLLQLDTNLIKVAINHCMFMAKTGEFNHDEPGSTFENRLKNEKVFYQAAGENLAVSYLNPTSVFQGWLASNQHNLIITHLLYNRVGFGKSVSQTGRVYWTAVYTQSAPANSLDFGFRSYALPKGLVNAGTVTVLNQIDESSFR